MPAFHSELNIQSTRLRKLAFMLVPSDPNNYAPLGKAVNLGHLPFVTAVTHAFRLGFLKAFLPLQFGKNVFRTCLSLQQMANSCVSVPDDSSSPVNVNWTMCDVCVCFTPPTACWLCGDE